MLLQLSSLSKIPRPDGVVETTGPELGSVVGNVDAAGAVGMSLELPNERLVVQIPNGDVAVTAAAETDLRIWAHGERVTCWGT